MKYSGMSNRRTFMNIYIMDGVLYTYIYDTYVERVNANKKANGKPQKYK